MAADADTQIRRKYAQRLAACIARNDLHSSLTVKADDGVAPAVIALGHEKVDVVFPRIEAAGGRANLFVIDSDDRLHVVRMTQRVEASGSGPAENPIADVHSNITMDFLVLFMRQNRSGSMRVAFSGVDVEAESAPKLELAKMTSGGRLL